MVNSRKNESPGEPGWLALGRHQFLRTTDQGAAGQSLSDKMFERRRIVLLDENTDKKFTYSQFSFDSSFIISGVDLPAHRTESIEPLNSVIIATTLNGLITDNTQSQEELYFPGDALVMSPGENVNLMRSNGHSGFGIVVLQEKLEAQLSNYYGIQTGRPIVFDRRLNLNSGTGKSLSNLLYYICSEADDESSALSLGLTRDRLEDLLVNSVLECISHSYTDQMQGAHNRARPVHVKRAVDYIMDNLQQDIMLKDLETVSNVSARSLQLGFNETYGISPMKFIRDVRLKRAREELLKCGPDSMTIAEVAERWHFQHHSQFSRLYQKRFGELPSKTLTR